MHAMETLKYLLIPARGAAIVLIVPFSFLLLLAAQGGLMGLPLALIVFSWFFKYGFALLDKVADGVNEPPVLSYEMVNPANESRPLGLLAIVGLFYFGTDMLQPTLGSGPVTVLRAIGLVGVPAIIMAEVMEGFVESLNPIRLLQIIARVPDSYVLILALLAGSWWLATDAGGLAAVGRAAAFHCHSDAPCTAHRDPDVRVARIVRNDRWRFVCPPRRAWLRAVAFTGA